MRLWLLVAASSAVAVAWGEWLNQRWSRLLVRPGDRHDGTLAVLVPGFRNPGGSINAVNRWRARIALRTIGTGGGDAVVVFSGGAVGHGPSEAELMARYARTHLGFTGRLMIEDRSRTTWENVTHVLPLIEDADRIAIASQPAHALKVRAYVHRQRPELAGRLVRGADYRFGEWAPAKPFLALYGVWTLRTLQPSEHRTRIRLTGFRRQKWSSGSG